MPPPPSSKILDLRSQEAKVATIAAVGIAAHLSLRFTFDVAQPVALLPLYATLALGGIPMLVGLGRNLLEGEFGSDMLAGIAILTSAFVQEYLAGAIIVLMWSGGTTLEQYAAGRASAALRALVDRMPKVAHRKIDAGWNDITLDLIEPGFELVVLPHETCPADGHVSEGHGHMDESYLTGEPYQISKAPGVEVFSGALNGDSALTIVASTRNSESRYSQILKVLESAGENQPKIKRLAQLLGAWYTPLALVVATAGWLMGDDPKRFLAVLVIATPCPLLIAIPIAIMGSVGVAARRGIIVRSPAALEVLNACRTMILDKTGTLTEGKPALTDVVCGSGFDRQRVLQLAATLEQYSRHPLALAVNKAAADGKIDILEASHVGEQPGAGLVGDVAGHKVQITGRGNKLAEGVELPPVEPGLECLVFVDQQFAALFRFRDEPRVESRPFIGHLFPRHNISRILIVSGDRESEVKYLAGKVGIEEIYSGKSPEEKVAIVTEATKKAKTLYVGDGINDAPAMMAATVGVALGKKNDVTAEAAAAVILDGTLAKVDELMHISRRMRTIALQSAIGGIALSMVGMGLAAGGHLSPVAGAVAQEVIDLLAVLNALRCAFTPDVLRDFPEPVKPEAIALHATIAGTGGSK